jgi:hypothetical protein
MSIIFDSVLQGLSTMVWMLSAAILVHHPIWFMGYMLWAAVVMGGCGYLERRYYVRRENQ